MRGIELPSTNGFESGDLSERFSRLRAVVVGEAMLDVYREGVVRRLSPEGPVPVVEGAVRRGSLGGAANVAANLVALGVDTALVSVVGRDTAADEILSIAAGRGIDTQSTIRDASYCTHVKERVVGDGRLLARVDHGSHQLTVGAEIRMLTALAEAIDGADLLVVSDYRYGVIGDGLIRWLTHTRGQFTLVVDSKQLERFSGVRPDAVTSNYEEAAQLLAETPTTGSDRLVHLGENSHRLAQATGAAVTAVTLDSDGVLVIDPRGSTVHMAATSRAVDTCGAGDTFTATMAAALAAGGSASASVKLASKAAGLVVRRHGTATCSLDELTALASKWCDLPKLTRLVEQRREDGDRLVLTNGCFDVLHAGHLASLEEAAAMGDYLVVAVNDDDSVRRLKGPDRPVNSVGDRVALLAGLAVVDHVVTFSDDSPLRILRELRPEIYTKGGDYQGRWIPEAELVRTWGGRFATTSYVADRSTTALVEKLRGRGVIRTV